jgi:hypothetical protein
MSRVEKIILNRDIILNAAASNVPGSIGRVLVQQDETGFHSVELPEGHFGNITVELTALKTTLLEYIVSDDGVFWTSTILTSSEAFNQPSGITDLAIYIVDANGAKIRWTAPKGNPPTNDAATRYRIKYSESAIDTNYSIDDLPEYPQTIVPGEPGSPESIVITGLLPNHKYYATVVSEKLMYGKLKSSIPSNVITFTTPANDSVSAEVPAIIPLIPENFFGNALVIDTDPNSGEKMYPTNLANLSGIIDDGTGVPTGTPPTVGMGIVNFGVGDMPQYNRPSWDLLIDLNGSWSIEYIYVWMEANGEIDVNTSVNGVYFNTTWSVGKTDRR